MEGLAGSGSGTKIGINEDVTTRNHFQDWEAFSEFLRNRHPPRLLSECTVGDAVEFVRLFPSDKVEIEAVASSLIAASFMKMDGNCKEKNPLESPVVRTFLKRLLKEKTSTKEKKLTYSSVPDGRKFEFSVDKENLFEQCLTATDVGNLNRFFIGANKEAEKYFPLASFLGGTQRILRFEDEDEEGKAWMFKYSYHWQSYVLTDGWSCYVKEKQLGAEDFVFFQWHLTDKSRLFIGCRRRHGGTALRNDAHESSPSAVLNPTSSVTSAKMLEMREKLKGS